MFCFLARAIFEPGNPETDARLLSSLCTKIEKRFKVTCRLQKDRFPDQPTIVFTGLGPTSQRSSETIDGIFGFCENHGLGRVTEDVVFLDDIEDCT